MTEEMIIRLERQTQNNVDTLLQAQACAALNQPMDIFGMKWKVVSIQIVKERPEIGLSRVA